MEFNEPKLYSDLIVKYRQRLDTVTFELERALAQTAQKDQRIAELIQELEFARAPSGPRGPTGDPAPKPGPPSSL